MTIVLHQLACCASKGCCPVNVCWFLILFDQFGVLALCQSFHLKKDAELVKQARCGERLGWPTPDTCSHCALYRLRLVSCSQMETSELCFNIAVFVTASHVQCKRGWRRLLCKMQQHAVCDAASFVQRHQGLVQCTVLGAMSS